MQHDHFQTNQKRGGGRITSPDYRQSLKQIEDFAGLEADTNRYDLLRLVKRVGKLAGFSQRMIQLLEYYLAFTREQDWEEGSYPLVYQSLARTARDLNCTERHIQRVEKQLFEVGAITWNDSGNHKRYGQRDPKTGDILYAYGVDLTPLAYLKPELEDKLHEKQLYDQAWYETKREISWYRSQIRGLLYEMQTEEGGVVQMIQVFEPRYQEIAYQIRNHMDVAALRTLLDRHKKLHSELLVAVEELAHEQPKTNQASNMDKILVVKTVHNPQETSKMSSRSDRNVSHIQYKTQLYNFIRSPSDPCLQESVVHPSEQNPFLCEVGLEHIRPKHVLQAASDRFRERLPIAPRPMNWDDVIEAAHRLCPELHVSQNSWGNACQRLTREGAALALIITDQGTQRSSDPVRNSAAYFRGMVNKAETGDLQLNKSIFGLVDKCLESEAV